MTDFSRVVHDAFHKQRLDQARGLSQLMKDQMTTGDVPTTVDGPASGRKRKKKGPGDCGPDGAHVAKTKVAGYTRVVNGKVVHVSGYVTGGRAAIDAMSDEDITRRAANPRNKTFNFASRNDPPRGAGMGPNFQTDAEFGRDRPKKPNPGRKSNLERIIAESKDKDQVAAATAELERRYGKKPAAAAKKPAAAKPKFKIAEEDPRAAAGSSPTDDGGTAPKVTSVKQGSEAKFAHGITVKRGKKNLGKLGPYSLHTDAFGQVTYGRRQTEAQSELEYLLAHEGGKKKDPKYKWQEEYDIGEVLAGGSKVTGFWRNNLYTERPNGERLVFMAGLGAGPEKKKSK